MRCLYVAFTTFLAVGAAGAVVVQLVVHLLLLASVVWLLMDTFTKRVHY